MLTECEKTRIEEQIRLREIELRQYGFKLYPISYIYFSRAKSYLGKVTYLKNKKNKVFRVNITISEACWNVAHVEDTIDSVILHELIHTMVGMEKENENGGHGEKFQKYARMIEKLYPNVKIYAKGTQEERESFLHSNFGRYKYIFTCNKCGRGIGFYRKTKNINRINHGEPINMVCVCGSHDFTCHDLTTQYHTKTEQRKNRKEEIHYA